MTEAKRKKSKGPDFSCLCRDEFPIGFFVRLNSWPMNASWLPPRWYANYSCADWRLSSRL
jgi:hypothetical protein